MKDNRKIMPDGSAICLCREDTGSRETFTVLSEDSTGGSCVCYFARCGIKRGRLKEFYPCARNCAGGFAIDRGEDNQLYCSRGKKALFDEMISDYSQSYHNIENIKQSSGYSSVLNTFIPSFEIYRGCDVNGDVTGSIYIWTADSTGEIETFDSIIKKIHGCPDMYNDNTVFLIIDAVKKLCECVQTIHSLGFIHCDIKPSNFGLPVRNGRYLTDQISLFDINSMCGIDDTLNTFAGTPGFCAPELGIEGGSKRADVFSIGAVLYTALTVTGDGEYCLYNVNEHSKIEKNIENSLLIRSCKAASSENFIKTVAELLLGCLQKFKRSRTETCTEVIAQLERAEFFLLPAVVNRPDSEYKLEIVDTYGRNDAFDGADSVFAIQSFLFNRPIYETGEDKIRVLTVGFDIYARKFLDCVMQAGQFVDTPVEYTVISLNPQVNLEKYIKENPELPNFFVINGKGCPENSLGEIIFTDAGQKLSNINLLRLTVEQFVKEHRCTYSFCSLADENSSVTIANACSTTAKKNGFRCISGYVSQSDKPKKTEDTDVVAVCVSVPAGKTQLYPEIDRIAFNIHLTWNTALNFSTDIRKEHDGFLRPYNHSSSLSCAMSIKSKLHCMGTELSFTPEGMREAAKQFKAIAEKYGKMSAYLAYAEHKRWVVEKITSGWKCRTDYSLCTGDSINDTDKREHVCIVKSRPEYLLDKYYTDESGRRDAAKWNGPVPEDKLLDGLDTVSVSLHRSFRKKAAEVRESFILYGNEMKSISSFIENDLRAASAFNAYMLCLEKIWNGDVLSTKIYGRFRDAFKSSVADYPQDVAGCILRYLEIIEKNISPMIKASAMRDYKQTDRELIEATPFILTYSGISSVFVPMEPEKNRFANVAAVTVINPSRIVYVCPVTDGGQIYSAKDTVDGIIAYIHSKNLKSVIDFIFIYPENEKTEGKTVAVKRSDVIGSVEHLRVKDLSEALETVKEKAGNADIFEKNSTALSVFLSEKGFYDGRATYSFDSFRMKFSVSDGCEWLNYLRVGKYLTAVDMFAVNAYSSFTDELPEFEDGYGKLWEIYTSDAEGWKSLRESLCEYSAANDTVAVFKRPADGRFDDRLVYTVPAQTYGCYRSVIKKLCSSGAVSENSCIKIKTTSSCTVVIESSRENREAVKGLFDDSYKFISEDCITVDIKKDAVSVIFDSLRVSSMLPPENSGEKIRDILTRLSENGFISNYRENGGAFSFVYPTVQMKRLLRESGRILEIYVYHKAQHSSFDDIVSGYGLDDSGNMVFREYDCIITSGFASIIAGCEVQTKITGDFYDALRASVRRFGVNSTAVLIADSVEITDECRKYGNSIGVVTVTDREKITDIDKTLKEIFKERYDSDVPCNI